MIRSLCDLSRLSRLSSFFQLALATALLAVVPAASSAWAQSTGAAGAALEPACPPSSADADPLTAVQNFPWQGRNVVARACWIGAKDRQGDRVVLELQLEGQPLLRQQVSAGPSLEGPLEALRFDNTRFVLSERVESALTLGLRLSTRNRGAQMDDRFVYLWLYHFDGSRLRRVFEMTVDERSDFRDCNDECALATLSHSILIVQPGAGHHGLRDLRQRQKSWTEGPDGKPVGGVPPWSDQIYFFDGVSYQRQP